MQFYREFGKNIFGLNPYGTIPGVVIFHVAFGLPFEGSSDAQTLERHPQGLTRSGPHGGRGGVEGLLSHRVAARVPALASLAIFQFIWVWNDLLVALVFLGGNLSTPLTVFSTTKITSFRRTTGLFRPARSCRWSSHLLCSSRFERYFVRGVLAGAVK